MQKAMAGADNDRCQLAGLGMSVNGVLGPHRLASGLLTSAGAMARLTPRTQESNEQRFRDNQKFIIRQPQLPPEVRCGQM